MTVFDTFKSVPYTFMKIAQSNIAGDVILSRSNFTGVFKDKGGMVQNGDRELYQSSPILYVKPLDYAYNSSQGFIGNGIEINGKTYRIDGATGGFNYDNGVLEHWRLTLAPAEFNEVDDD